MPLEGHGSLTGHGLLYGSPGSKELSSQTHKDLSLPSKPWRDVATRDAGYVQFRSSLLRVFAVFVGLGTCPENVNIPRTLLPTLNPVITGVQTPL